MSTDNLSTAPSNFAFGGVVTPLRRDQGAQVGAQRPGVEFVLPKEAFAAQLKREMRRVDRSGGQLSLLVFRLDAEASDLSLLRLHDKLSALCRETDMLGAPESRALGLICPDTGETGARRLADKIAGQTAGLAYAVETATYPDELFHRLSSSPSVDVRDTRPLLLETHAPAASGQYWLKRPLDVIGALVAILLFSPVMLATALAVKLSSPGPIVFRQKRIGKGGVPFAFYKFRSMRIDGDDRIHREYVSKLIKGQNEQVNQATGDDKPVYKLKADPRITRVGHIIRRTSIDELPQLFNVLMGNMSLVGPRPPVPYEAENYRSWHLRRVLDVPPGITGLWQVEGRSKVTFDEMVRMDLRYVRDCSLALDLRILARTALVVLRCDGAA